MKREDVYKLIDGERDYMDILTKGATTPGGRPYIVEEWLYYIDYYLRQAKNIPPITPRPIATTQAMAIIRKLAGMCVCAMEKIDTPAREIHK